MMLSKLLQATCYEVSDPSEAKALTFMISFETAQFKKHLIKLYRDTYLSPLPSTVLGMLGAVMGVRRGHLREFACEKGLLTGAALMSYEGIVSETMTVVKMKGWREYIRTPKMSVLLYKPIYKVAVASPDRELIEEFKDRLLRLDFEFELFGGNDYNFLSWIGEMREAELVRAKQGIGYCRLTDLDGFEGSGTLHIDEVKEAKVFRYAFSQGVTLKLKNDALAVQDGQHTVFVHESWKFVR